MSRASMTMCSSPGRCAVVEMQPQVGSPSLNRLRSDQAEYGIRLDVDQALDLFLGRSVTAVFQHYEALGRSIPKQFAAELRAGVRAAFLSSICPIEGVITWPNSELYH